MRTSSAHVVRRVGCLIMLAAGMTASVTPVSASAALPRAVHRAPIDRLATRPKPIAHEAFNSVASGPAIIAEAAKFAGTPYRYGGTGPDAFDCSGYVRAVFRRFGIELPRTSGAQRDAVSPVAAGARRPGDLVFFLTPGGRVFHDGIYAGGNAMWDAPSTGKSVSLNNIWSSRVSYGRAQS